MTTPPRPPLSLAISDFLFAAVAAGLAINWWVTLPEPFRWIFVAVAIAIALFALYMGLVALYWWRTRR